MKIMKLSILLFVIVLSYSGIINAQNYDHNFFPIGVWSVRGDFRPVDDFLFEVDKAAAFHHKSFKDLKEQGFNSAFLSYDPIGPTLDTILDIAKLYDLKIIAPMQNLHQVISRSNDDDISENDIREAILNDSIERIKKSSQIIAYYLYDEPLPGWIDFDILETSKNILADMTSDAPHPIVSAWNDEQYMEYIDNFLNLDVLMMDSYPFEDGDAKGDISDYMPSYFSSMPDPLSYSDYINSVRENHCEKNNRPFWVIFQAFGDLETPENGGYWRQVYPKEIRLQVYLAIMQGAKGIWYFLYESEFPYLLGMLDVSGQPTVRLLEAIEVNKEISAISSALLKLRVFPDQSVINIDKGEAKLHYDTTGTLKDKYIICVNTDIFSQSQPNISIDTSALGYNLSTIVDMQNNEIIPFTIDNGKISLSPILQAGSGRLLRLSQKTLITSEETDKDDYLVTLPNPASTNINIVTNTKINDYRIFDLNGILKLSGVYSGRSIPIDKLVPGVYFIRFNTEKGLITKKIFKIK